MWSRLILITLLAAPVFPAAATELPSGVSLGFFVPAQTETTLVTGFDFNVPPGARWAIVQSDATVADFDIELFVNFNDPITAGPGDTVNAAFHSQTPGTPEEFVSITPGSNPGIETGRYHVAFRVKTLDVAAQVILRATVEIGSEPTSLIASTFDTLEADGWTRNYPPSAVPGASVGDPATNVSVPPDGFFRMTDYQDPPREFAVAPPKFLGDLSPFSNAKFTFDFRHNSAEAHLPIEIRLLGEGAVFRWKGQLPPLNEWGLVTAPLEAGEWERIFGAASFEQVLTQVGRIELAMDYSVGPESNDLDNFTFSGDPPLPPSGPGAPALSTFEAGLDGWRRNFPASAIPGDMGGTSAAAVRQGLGGFESDGSLLLIDGGGIAQDYAVAPDKFIRGLASLDRPWYEFYYRQLSGSFPFVFLELRLLGGGSVYRWGGTKPRENWRRYQLPIEEQYWTHVSGPEDFQNMLANVQRLEVSMDGAVGYEVNGLDNFALLTEYTAPAGRALQLDRDTLELNVSEGDPAASSTTLRITASGGGLPWMASVDPPSAGWLGLSKTSGDTPDETEIQVDPAGLTPGLYQAEVVVSSSDAKVSEVRLAVTLVVGDDPRVPLLLSGGAIHAAEPAIPLSPGALGSLFGKFLAAQDLVLSFSDGLLPVMAAEIEVKVWDGAGALLARAPLLLVSAGQINFQMPYESAGLDSVLLSVCRDGVESNRIFVGLDSAGPEIFRVGDGLSAILNQDGSLNAPDAAAPAGSFVTVYFTGLGAVEPPIESGRMVPAEPLRIPQGVLSAEIAGSPAEILGAALSPGFSGLAQMSLRIAAGVAGGQHLLRIAIDGRQSNGVLLWTR